MHSTRGNTSFFNVTRNTNPITSLQSAASSQQIQAFQVMQVNNVADEKPSTSCGLQKACEQPSTSSPWLSSSSSSTSLESQFPHEEFPFKIERDFVSDTFWDLLLKELPQEQFYKNYNDFLLTNWNCSKKHRDNLIKIRINARTAKKRYNALIQSLFQYDLRVSAFKLIHSILGIGRYNRMLKNIPESEFKKTKNSRDNALKNINENYVLAFDKYVDYLDQRNEKKPTMEQIELLDKAIIKTRRKYTIYDKFIVSKDTILDVDEIPNNLNFINAILNKIKDGKLLTLDIATELAKEYNPYKKPSIPTSASTKHANKAPLAVEKLSQKRKFTQLEQLLLATKAEVTKNTKNIDTPQQTSPPRKLRLVSQEKEVSAKVQQKMANSSPKDAQTQSSDLKSSKGLQFTLSKATNAYDEITIQTSPLSFITHQVDEPSIRNNDIDMNAISSHFDSNPITEEDFEYKLESEF